MPADQEADVLPLDIRVNLLVPLLDRNGRFEPKLLENPLEHDAHALSRLFRQHSRLGLDFSFHAGSLTRLRHQTAATSGRAR